MIGATADAIDKAEDRERFREAMTRIGLETPRSHQVKTLPDALKALEDIGLPAIIRPSFTLGGTGGGIAYNKAEFIEIVERGIDASPTNEVLIEELVLGWKEFEMEVVRDKNDNCIIICSIENLDPMGVHTGDSITIAPALTLTDKEYQIMRDASIAVLREIGVETGGSNVQFAVNPADGRLVIIEMNPRVSRSSALASKATGFPIAKVAAKLAVGYTLDEIANDITGGATPGELRADHRLRRHQDSALRVREIPRRRAGADHVDEIGRRGDGDRPHLPGEPAEGAALAGDRPDRARRGDDRGARPGRRPQRHPRRARHARRPTGCCRWRRPCGSACRDEHIHAACKIDPWFLAEIRGIVETEAEIKAKGLPTSRRHAAPPQGDGVLRRAAGGARPAAARREVTAARRALGVRPVFKRIDTCAAEFASPTAYMYSTYETPFAGAPADEAAPSDRKKVVILGGGPNRIGQGIEFDYCCCHAAFALRDAGYETIMINCNPETVSTDYDTSDRLYFEPLTAEDVIEIIDTERANGTLHGVIVQFGGQTPLKLAEPLERANVPDPRHLARRHRSRRGPQPLQAPARPARPQAAEQRHRLFGRAGPAGGGRPRLSDRGAALLCAGRPRDADHPRGGAARRLSARHLARARAARRQGALSQRQDRADQHRARQEPAAVRPLPVGCGRGRRRLPRRRQATRSSPASWSTSRKPAFTPAIPPARCRRTISSPRPSPSSTARPASWRWRSRSAG